jgi:GH24 family phage-related lysozyme (muramidase)
MNQGISSSEAEALLKNDLRDAYSRVLNYMKKIGVSIPLSLKQMEMLTEFAFNLGDLGKFPKFTKAVLNQDWVTADKEHNRYSRGIDLKRRNDIHTDLMKEYV